MRTLESKIEQKVCRDALRMGVRNLKLNVTGQTGWPDRMFLIPGGRALFIEFKRPGSQVRPKQEYIHQVLRHLGYHVEIHDDPVRALQAIRQALDAALLSKEGSQVSVGTRRRRAVLGPRTGQDIDHAGRD